MPQRTIQYCEQTLRQMWASGASYQEIAAAIGCGESFIHKLKLRHKLPNRQKPTKEIFADDPTPEQIAVEAAKLRAAHMEHMRLAPMGHIGNPRTGIRVYSLGPNPFRAVS